MIILNVAEKPSVAKSIARVLSTNVRTEKGKYKYCPNHTFDLDGDEMIFTSVVGHLNELTFDDKYKNWKAFEPKELFTAKVKDEIRSDLVKIKENIQSLSSRANMVVIWTDCDREGENIGNQIKKLISGKPVKRARFLGISRHEINKAFDNLVDINQHESDAVDARRELDLRCGCAFTILQSLSLQNGMSGGDSKRIISYGPCQIPTLNFVVERHRQIVNFVAERFYSLSIECKQKKTDEFSWDRGHVFDKNAAIHFYNLLKNDGFMVEYVSKENRTKYKPLPLRTVELQKLCTSYYKIPGSEIMNIAEKLYNNGYISYPRTETDSFDDNFGFNRILDNLKEDRQFSDYLNEFQFNVPKKGKNSDQAHSPIYPLKDGNDLSGRERNVYDFIARRFIACCSENAKGEETIIKIRPKTNESHQVERFTTKGLKIKEYNYLDIYPYDKWASKTISNEYLQGQVLQKTELLITDGNTSAPEYLTEKDLINLMDKNGIGTDATIHEHIAKIQTRDYAFKVGQYIKPSETGINLIDAYIKLELPINECNIRKEMEENLTKISRGQLTKNTLVKREIVIYTNIYDRLHHRISDFVNIMRQHQDIPRRGKKAESVTNGGGGRGPGGGAGGKDTQTESNKKRNTEKPNTTSKFNRNDENIKSNSPIKCDCGKEANKVQTSKGKNKGKWFYGCCEFPSKCNFFIWEGEEQPAKRQKRVEVVDEVLCDCDKPAVRKVSSTDKTRGKQFYCCNKNYKKCNFFKWAEE